MQKHTHCAISWHCQCALHLQSTWGSLCKWQPSLVMMTTGTCWHGIIPIGGLQVLQVSTFMGTCIWRPIYHGDLLTCPGIHPWMVQQNVHYMQTDVFCCTCVACLSSWHQWKKKITVGCQHLALTVISLVPKYASTVVDTLHGWDLVCEHWHVQLW